MLPQSGAFFISCYFQNFERKCPLNILTLHMPSAVNIDFKLLSSAFQIYIRKKAKISGSTIVYIKGDQLIEENPKTFKQRILKQYITAK